MSANARKSRNCSTKRHLPLNGFADRVIAWQKVHGRHDLPWQQSRDAYRIWLSEIMLQQTQVATVIPYYGRFVERFSDVRALAAAPLETVMSSWAGLGYYSRARNLHRCAQQIVAEHGAEFPRSAELLAQLPGIGRSTAAAVAALAFGERAAILDGNVKRVLTRLFGVDGYPGNPSVERVLWQHAEDLLPADDIESYTQGLMDLGATVCTRGRPQCAACPVSDSCRALRERTMDVLPTPRPAKQPRVRSAILLVIHDANGAVLLELRPPSGIWGGLLSLPEFEADTGVDGIVAAMATRYGLRISMGEALGDIRHEFTHYTYVMRPRRAHVVGTVVVASASLRGVCEAELESAPLPAPIRRLLRQLAQPMLV